MKHKITKVLHPEILKEIARKNARENKSSKASFIDIVSASENAGVEKRDLINGTESLNDSLIRFYGEVEDAADARADNTIFFLEERRALVKTALEITDSKERAAFMRENKVMPIDIASYQKNQAQVQLENEAWLVDKKEQYNSLFGASRLSGEGVTKDVDKQNLFVDDDKHSYLDSSNQSSAKNNRLEELARDRKFIQEMYGSADALKDESMEDFERDLNDYNPDILSEYDD